VSYTPTYKHAVSVTNQIYFCAAPIRIDAYDTCQFSCVYCFSRIRSRYQARAGIHAANPSALRKRLERVKRGEIASALDEFLARRVPIQLGGLQDPFTPRELGDGITLELLRVLRDENYPTLISTKGNLFLQPEYLDILEEMNVVFRISAAGANEVFRPMLEPKTGPYTATLDKIAMLTDRNVSVALRIQPVVPGFEAEALEMTSKAAEAGAGQVTFEYLKLPSESVRKDIAKMNGVKGYDIVETMAEMGLRRVGPDWALSRDAKRPFIRVARAHCRKLGIKFGAGDTEFIPWSDGDGCCGSSSLFLNGAEQFVGNFVGAIKNALTTGSRRVTFAFIEQQWSPRQSIGNYLDWRSRVPASERDGRTDWRALMGRRWNGGRSPYSPTFFDGVIATAERDANGFTVYDATSLANELGVISISPSTLQPSSRE